MLADTLDRRVAAWLLTLPGPLKARSHENAAREAHRLFDPRAPREAFERALWALGYEVAPHRGRFAIARADEGASRVLRRA